MHYKINVCLKYFWSSLYSPNTEKLLYSGRQILTGLRVYGEDRHVKGQLQHDECQERDLPAECSGQIKGTLSTDLGTLILNGGVWKSLPTPLASSYSPLGACVLCSHGSLHMQTPMMWHPPHRGHTLNCTVTFSLLHTGAATLSHRGHDEKHLLNASTLRC